LRQTKAYETVTSMKLQFKIIFEIARKRLLLLESACSCCFARRQKTRESLWSVDRVEKGGS